MTQRQIQVGPFFTIGDKEQFPLERGCVSHQTATTCAEAYRSSCFDYPWTVCVIHDAVNVVFSQMESDHRISRPCVGTPLEDDHRRFAIYFSNSQSPGQGPAPPIREIRGICKFARKGVGNIESSVRTDQLANPVPVAAVKTLDIELHHAPQFRARWPSGFWTRRRGRQSCSRAIEGGFNPTNRGVDHFSDFF